MSIVPSRSFAGAAILLALSFPVGLARDVRASEAQELGRGGVEIRIAAEGGPRDGPAEAVGQLHCAPTHRALAQGDEVDCRTDALLTAPDLADLPPCQAIRTLLTGRS